MSGKEVEIPCLCGGGEGWGIANAPQFALLTFRTYITVYTVPTSFTSRVCTVHIYIYMYLADYVITAPPPFPACNRPQLCAYALLNPAVTTAAPHLPRTHCIPLSLERNAPSRTGVEENCWGMACFPTTNVSHPSYTFSWLLGQGMQSGTRGSQNGFQLLIMTMHTSLVCSAQHFPLPQFTQTVPLIPKNALTPRWWPRYY